MPTVKAHLKIDGLYVGVDPAIPDVVYADRPAAGGWETVELREHDDHIGCDVYFPDAGVFLCLTPDGALETRATGGGAWETFSVAEQLNAVTILNGLRDGGLVRFFDVEILA